MIIPIFGGHVRTRQRSPFGIPTMFEWGAVRGFRVLPDDVGRAYDDGLPHWRAFAGESGFVLGEGYISAVHLNEDGSGSYEFAGIGKPIVGCDR